MFTTFPDEWPGAGILLLRVGMGVAFVAQGIAYLGADHELKTLIIALLMVVGGALLLIGSLSRWVALAAAATSLLSLFSWFPAPRVGLFESPITAFIVIVVAVSLACMGPGAFSLDARLFGRREVIIPEDSAENQN